MFKPYNKAEIAFELRREIGQAGANSKTYVAQDEQLDAEIVIKQVPKISLDSVDAYFDESKILYLSAHANVVQIHYACQDSDNVFIAMPYYKRGSLSDLIDSRFLTVREIVVLGCQIASGLHNIHSKRLIHFDVKPDNVLLNDRGEALVSDFGLSRRLSNGGTAGQDRMYMRMRPPEAYGTSDFTRAFDIYQFGLTLYRMCSGNAQFNEQFSKFGTSPSSFDRDAFKFAVRNGNFPDRDAFEEHIPERLRRLVRKCLEPNPVDRFQAALEVCNQLAQVEDRLDWKFEWQGTTRVWARSDQKRSFRIEVDQSGRSKAEKTSENGRTSRIAAYCKDRITSQEIRRFLGET